MKAGGAYLPIDPDYPEARKKYMLQDSGVRLVLTNCEMERLSPIAPGAIEMIDTRNPHLYTGDDEGLAHRDIVDGTHLVYIIYTSGSTGKPKGIMLEHRNLLNLMRYQFGCTEIPFDRVLQFTTISFDVSFQEIFSTLLAGGTLYLIDKETRDNIDELLKTIEENEIKTLFLPASFLKFVLNEEDCIDRMPRSVRHIITAGEQVVVSPLFRGYLKRNHVWLHNHYGPAETHVVTTLAMDPAGRIPELPPIGKPVLNTAIYILDRQNDLQPIGVPGEIVIAGAQVGRGYWRKKALTSERFVDNPFAKGEKMYRTGDLGRWLPAGNIEFLGRADQQVKIRGFRIEMGEIEHQLLAHEAVKEAVVIHRETNTGDKYLCAYVVPHGTHGAWSIEHGAWSMEHGGGGPALKEFLSQTLPDYMIPSFFITLEKIPLTPNGKLDRRALPAPGVKVDAHEEVTAPTNKTGKELAAIWADILGIEKNVIGIDNNFFQLGGHSLKATILISRVHKRLRVKIPLQEFFKNPTIRGLSQYAAGAREEIHTGLEPVEKKEYYALSPAQKRLYILHQMDKHGTGYNLPSVLELEGSIDKNRLEKSFKKLLERHESLRTFFITINGEPAQKIHEKINFTITYDEVSDSLISQFIRPFDLSHAPLLRMTLLEKEKEKYLAVIDMHHIISDGMSLGVFVKEFMALYGGETLSPLKVQYKDYSEWSHKEKEKTAYRQQAEYWQKQFEGEIPVLELPTDFVRPRVQGFEGSRIKFESAAAETQRLKTLALKESTTLYMVLLAAYNVFLFKISNRETLVVGTPVAGRRHADLEQIIGMFVNTLAVKHYPQSQKTFNRFLQEVNQGTLEAFENQDYPFEELVEKAAVNRDTARNPLFDVLFVLQNMDVSEINIPGLKLRPYNYKSNTAKFDLMLQAVEVNENLVFTFEYSTRLFKESTIRRFTGYFKKVLSTVVEKTAVKISDIEIISEQEKKQLLYDFNDTAADYPRDKTIHQLFEEQVEKTPDKIAVVFNRHSITYETVNKKAGRLAYLLNEKGARPDTIVGIMAERSVEMIIGLLGTLKAGGAYLPIEPGYPEERINYMLTDSGAKVLLTDLPEGRLFNCHLSIVNCQLLTSSPGITLHHSSFMETPNHSDLAYIIYTSGTTGKPKGVMIEHRNVVRLMFNDKFLFDFNCRDTWTMFHSCCFDFSVWEMYGALLYGGKLVVVPQMAARDSLGYLEILKENQVTVLNQTPSAFYNLMDLELENPRKELNIRYVIFGGEALTPSRLKNWKTKYPAAKLINMYGITETTVHVTFKEITGKEIGSDAGNIGRPIATLSTYIMDKHSKPMPMGAPGELAVGGEGVGRGYLNRQELTDEKFVKNPYKPGDRLYRSGDLAKLSSGGDLEYMGRIDHQVKIRGFRVELGEIESRLLTYKPVKEAVVIDRKDQHGDKYLCAYIVTLDVDMDAEGMAFEKMPKPMITQLKEHLSRTLPDYMIPPYFVIMDHIPLTPNGKVDRKALPEPEAGAGGEYRAPRNRTEEILAETWAEVLEIDKDTIGIDADFFDLGGHSLKAAALISKIEKRLNARILLTEVFASPSIKEMAKHISPADQGQFLSIEPAEEKEFYPLTPMQNQFFILDQLQTVKTAYNLPSVLTVEGKLDRRKFKEAILKLIRRHATLRTSFVIADEKPVQRIHREVDFELEYHKLFGSQTEVEFIKHFIRPFDLSCAPLLRVGLLKVEEEKHILIFDMHHIISDGTSLGILVRDIVTLYEGNQRPPLPIQYKDYSQWLSSPGGKETIAKQETYWLDQYNGPLPVLNMYTDFPRPPVQSFTGDAILFSMGKTLTRKIRQLTAETGVTLFMLLLAALNVLLSRYSAQEDIVVGTPIAGRVHADFEDIIALFINVLPIRNFPQKNKTFRQFLTEVKENTLQAYENQGYPFETLLEKLNVEKDLGRNPLFDVELVVLNMDAPALETKGLTFTPYEHKLDVSQVDIDIYVAEYEEEIRANLMYCTDLFKKETIEGFIAFFKEILSTAADNKEVTLKDIEMSHHLAAARSRLIQDDTDDFEF
jgi:amino acid adenylation domain-containing protein